MTKKVISTVRHYKIRKDGTLRFVGIEKHEAEETHWGHIESLDARDAADALDELKDETYDGKTIVFTG